MGHCWKHGAGLDGLDSFSYVLLVNSLETLHHKTMLAEVHIVRFWCAATAQRVQPNVMQNLGYKTCSL